MQDHSGRCVFHTLYVVVFVPAFLNGSNYLSLPRDPQTWIIKDLIPVGGLTNLYGQPKTGKSFVALGMAHAISSGQAEWLNFAVRKHGPVAYLQIDTPRGIWADRLTDSALNLDGVFFCDSMMTGFYPFNALDPAHFKWLKSEIDLIQPIVVFIDTIREAHDGDENDSTVMRNVITNLVAACRPAAIVLLSHSRKDTLFTATGGDNLMADARGSSYTAGKMDCVIKMTGNKDGATGLSYQGRSEGRGRLSVTQAENGLVLLSGEDAKYHELLRRRVRELTAPDPNVATDKLATLIEKETTHRGHRTITKDINAILGRKSTPRPRALVATPERELQTP